MLAIKHVLKDCHNLNLLTAKINELPVLHDMRELL